ncbi:D-inositol-3-phosphate glycosyltransferase [subsurface metagenome]
MRVKFVNRGMGMYRGGGEIFDLNIAQSLEKLGVEISFLVGKPLFRRVKYPLEHFRTTYVASPYLRDISQKIPWGSKYLRYLDHWLFARNCLHILKKENDYDILQVCGRTLLVKLKRIKKKIPVVIRFPGPPGKRSKNLLSQADALIASGDAVKYIRGNFRRDVVDIPPGVDFNLFKPTLGNIRDKFSIGDNRLLLFVGRFVPLKNLPFLITTFRRVIEERKDIRLMLVGEGPLKNTIKGLVKKYQLEKYIIFTGRVPNDELPKYYSAADIFIMPSSYDNFPNSILEAMACELPIVATRVGGIPQQIQEGKNGLLIESNNIEEFKTAILKLINNDKLAQEIGRGNREMVKERYSWIESAQRLKKIYRFLLKG